MHQMVPQHFGTVSIPETVRTSKIKKYARLRVLTYIHTILRTEHFLIDAFSNVTFTSVHLYGTSYSNFRLTCSFTHYFSSSDSPHCSSITPCLFHCRLKTYLFHKSYSHTPVVSLHPPDCHHGLLPGLFLLSYSVSVLFFLIFSFLCRALG